MASTMTSRRVHKEATFSIPIAQGDESIARFSPSLHQMTASSPSAFAVPTATNARLSYLPTHAPAAAAGGVDESEEESCAHACKQCRASCGPGCCVWFNWLLAWQIVVLLLATITTVILMTFAYLVLKNGDWSSKIGDSIDRGHNLMKFVSETAPEMIHAVNHTVQLVHGFVKDSPNDIRQQGLAILNDTVHITKHVRQTMDIWTPQITDILILFNSVSPEDIDIIKGHIEGLMHSISQSNATSTISTFTKVLKLGLEIADTWKSSGGLALGMTHQRFLGG